MFLALDVPIPWKGLLLAYGAGQLAASLPITPGGLGVVEGSITVALVAFGGPEASTAYAVLLYRLISFWMILVVGWLFIGQLALQVRRGPLEPPGPGERGRGRPGGLRAPGEGRVTSRLRPDPRPAPPGPTPAGPHPRHRLRRRPRRWRRRSSPPARPPAATSARLTSPATWPCRRRPRRSAATATSRACASTRSSSLHGMAPRLYGRLAHDVPPEAVDLPGRLHGPLHRVGGLQAARAPVGHAGRGGGHHAGQQLLGTLILTKLPVRFQHTHPF